MFVWLTYSQTLAAVIAGCEAAWAFFGGVFKVLIPDNMNAVVTDADAVNPTAHRRLAGLRPARGFATDPARVRPPAGQAAGRADGAVRARQLLRRGGLRRSRRRAGPGPGAGARAGRAADPRHHARRARPRCSPRPRRALLLPAPAGPMTCRCSPGQGAPRLPRRGRQGAVLGARRADRAAPGRARRLASWSSSTTAGSWSRPTRGSRPAGARPTRPTCPPEKAGYAMRDLTG